MKRGGLVLGILGIFSLSIILGLVIVGAEEFKSCSLDSDCKVDVCNQNSCVNQSYQIPECISPTLLAKECHCVDNMCDVLVGSSVPVCDANHPDVTYCKDEKTMMVCSGGNWVSKPCVYKCQSGSCIAGCYKNEDCGGSYIRSYCSNNEVCLDTITPTCLDFGICGSNTVIRCTPCASGCSEGRCMGETTTTTSITVVPASCQSEGKCSDGTIVGCKLADNKCVCSPCPAIPALVQPTVQPTQICTDSDNGNFYEKGTMKGATDDIGHSDLCGDYNTLTEYYCENNGAKKTTFNCPNGCKEGACIKGESVSEKVSCIFKNSDREQKCYLSEYNDRFYCSGKDSCVIDVKGYRGEKMIWKSSCGSYIPTIIDGQDENVEFECKIGETTTTQIKNKGFKNAYFQCYDGEESKSIEREACKTADFWKKFAENFCGSHCENNPEKCKQKYENQEDIDKCLGKCGVNSFSVTNECYVEEATAVPTAVAVEATATTPRAVQGMLYYFKSDDCPHCQDIDKEIGILKQRGFFNNFGAAVFDINEAEIKEKFEIKAVPSFILYKDGCSFRKEGLMKSEEIENWAYESKCGEGTGETSEIIVEPVLVCRDSCPLDRKCYPFGYRKSEKFCSDSGGFIEQLKGDEKCDNNFECTSNVCVSGNCVSEGLLQKVLGWFKRLFGAG